MRLQLATPTDARVRTPDAFGDGKFGASRDGGSRKHTGVDYAAEPGSLVISPFNGQVTKLGYPYKSDLSFRYVQLTRGDGTVARFMYVNPWVKVGDRILPSQCLGTVQSLQGRYPGITDHVHVDIKKDGEWLNPETY